MDVKSFSLADCKELCDGCGFFKCRFVDTNGCPSCFRLGQFSLCGSDCLYLCDFHLCKNLGEVNCTISRLLRLGVADPVHNDEVIYE